LSPPRTAPALSSGKVSVRAHRPDDLDRLLEQDRDPQTVRWTAVPARSGRRQARDLLDRRASGWADGSELAFAISYRGEYAGTVALVPDGRGAATLSYDLHPTARGQHVASTAARLCLGWGFDTLDLDVVHWYAMLGNWPGRRVAWALGFQLEGTVRGLLLQRDERHDAWVGSLRRGDVLAPAHIWLDPVTVTGERVRLREHRYDDLQTTVEACNDPAVQRWLPQIPAPYRAQDALAHQEAIRDDHASGRALYWAVADHRNRMVGEIGLFGLRAGLSSSGELGYWTHPRHRGRGMTTEAVRLAARHALLAREDGGLGLRRVLIRAADGNLASQQVAQRAGFRPAGQDRAAEPLGDGSVQDGLRFDLVADDLVAGRSAADGSTPGLLLAPAPPTAQNRADPADDRRASTGKAVKGRRRKEQR
jgi:RimJ/RimL family protein N-acetyltransferase